MTFREQCAHDAYNSALRAMESRGVDRDGSNEEMGNDLAEVAWAYADAMEAQRLKRIPPPRPEPINDPDDIGADAPPRLTADQIAAVAQAHREGRDAGLRGMAAECEQAIRDTGGDSDIIPGLRRAIRMTARLAERQPTPAARRPTSADIASEKGGEWDVSPATDLASLQAVAEAAASLGRVELAIDRGEVGGHAASARKSSAIALAAALDRALPGWCTKENP